MEKLVLLLLAVVCAVGAKPVFNQLVPTTKGPNGTCDEHQYCPPEHTCYKHAK